MSILIVLTAALLIVQSVGSTSDWTVTAGYYGHKCDAGLPDVIFNNTNYTLYCHFGTDKLNIKSVVIGKGNDTLFDYQKPKVYIKGDIQGRSRVVWTREGVNIMVDTADITRDKAEYTCTVERNDLRGRKTQTFELNGIYNLPTKKELTDLIQTDEDNDKCIVLNLDPGFKEKTTSVNAKNYPKFNCNMPKVTWSGHYIHSCNETNGQNVVPCPLPIQESNLTQGETYDYRVKVKLYGVESGDVVFNVYLKKENKTVKIFVVLNVVGIIVLTIVLAMTCLLRVFINRRRELLTHHGQDVPLRSGMT